MLVSPLSPSAVATAIQFGNSSTLSKLTALYALNERTKGCLLTLNASNWQIDVRYNIWQADSFLFIFPF